MKRYLGILATLLLLAFAWQRLAGDPADAPKTPVAEDAAEDVGELTGPAADEAALASSGPAWETLTIGRGESFYVALQRAGFEHETIMDVVEACRPHTNLRKVQRGDEFALARADSGAFGGLRFDVDAEHFLEVARGEEGLVATLGRYPLERVVKGVRGEITSSLFVALQGQGADPSLAGQMADILGWDIDFFRDLREGDKFVVLYEEYLHEGNKVRDGRILAASFTNRGETHDAYLFENHLGLPAYYDGEGHSLEKQFLRAPLKFSRISSGFTKRRLHPVTKRYRPHYGVDYAAPTGTPVLATADGVVIVRQRKRAEGNHVGLRHGQTYESYYLHLSRYPKGLKVGDKVKQGDVIGYVGSTGYSTAAHLDYRIKKNGRWVDPRKLKLPPASPVPPERRDEYMAHRQSLEELKARIPADPTVLVLDSRPLEEVEGALGAGLATGR